MCISALLDNAVLFSKVDISTEIPASVMPIENGKFGVFCNRVSIKCCIMF